MESDASQQDGSFALTHNLDPRLSVRMGKNLAMQGYLQVTCGQQSCYMAYIFNLCKALQNRLVAS